MMGRLAVMTVMIGTARPSHQLAGGSAFKYCGFAAILHSYDWLCLGVGNRTSENHGESDGNLTACHIIFCVISNPLPCLALIFLTVPLLTGREPMTRRPKVDELTCRVDCAST